MLLIEMHGRTFFDAAEQNISYSELNQTDYLYGSYFRHTLNVGSIFCYHYELLSLLFN